MIITNKKNSKYFQWIGNKIKVKLILNDCMENYIANNIYVYFMRSNYN